MLLDQAMIDEWVSHRGGIYKDRRHARENRGETGRPLGAAKEHSFSRCPSCNTLRPFAGPPATQLAQQHNEDQAERNVPNNLPEMHGVSHSRFQCQLLLSCPTWRCGSAGCCPPGAFGRPSNCICLGTSSPPVGFCIGVLHRKATPTKLRASRARWLHLRQWRRTRGVS